MKTLRPQNLKLALRASSGLSVGSIYPLPLDRNILGRSVDASVPVDDSKVSRNHATVDLQNGFHYLADLGSINGTYLNGSKLEQAILISVGDEIRIGSTVFLVELLDQAKINAGKNWRDPTRAIMHQPEIIPAPGAFHPAPSPHDTGARWRVLIPTWTATPTSATRKWMVLALCVGIVATAIFTTVR